jgi:diguanylate cyclase (GGDEF)-like protein/PAS domain S-box-containing protein
VGSKRNEGNRILGSELQPEAEVQVFRLALQNAPCPILITDAQGTILLANDAAEQLLGYDKGELVGQPVEVLLTGGLRDVHVQHREEFMESPHRRLMGDRPDLVARAKNGEVIPVEVGLSPVETPSGLLVVCGITDLTARMRTQARMAEVTDLLEKKNEKLLQIVATDTLTGLKSRQAFFDHLDVQIEVSIRHARPLSILMLDIDHFKAYNDTFGHLAGDEILQQMGEVLMAVARRSDFVGRLGGEEFGIILPETGREGARVLAERFRAAIEACEWPRRGITMSVGAVTWAFDQPVPRPRAPDAAEILEGADQALYWSKKKGRNRVTHADDMEGTDAEDSM